MKAVHEQTLVELDGDNIKELKRLFKENLRLKSKLSKLSGAEIVPESVKQTVLGILDLDDPVLAGIPGAGGFDAIFTITHKNSHSHSLSQLSQNLPNMTLLEEDVV